MLACLWLARGPQECASCDQKDLALTKVMREQALLEQEVRGLRCKLEAESVKNKNLTAELHVSQEVRSLQCRVGRITLHSDA